MKGCFFGNNQYIQEQNVYLTLISNICDCFIFQFISLNSYPVSTVHMYCRQPFLPCQIAMSIILGLLRLLNVQNNVQHLSCIEQCAAPFMYRATCSTFHVQSNVQHLSCNQDKALALANFTQVSSVYYHHLKAQQFIYT